VRSVVYCIVYWHFSIGSVWVYLSALIVGLVAWQAWLALCSALHRRPSLSLTHTHLSSVLFSSLRISSLLSSILADDLFVALIFFHAISVCSLTYSLHFVHCPPCFPSRAALFVVWGSAFSSVLSLLLQPLAICLLLLFNCPFVAASLCSYLCVMCAACAFIRWLLSWTDEALYVVAYLSRWWRLAPSLLKLTVQATENFFSVFRVSTGNKNSCTRRQIQFRFFESECNKAFIVLISIYHWITI